MINDTLGARDRIILPRLDIKLGLMEQNVKAKKDREYHIYKY